MKKFVAFVLAMIMVFSLAVTVASAADCSNDEPNGRHPFKNVVLCSTEAMTFSFVTDACYRIKQKDDQRTFVQHTVSRGVASYTNYFVPTAPYDMSTTYGSKWVTPGQLIPIRSDNTVVGRQYGLKARGNTKHAKSGYNTITVNGFFNVN